MLGGSIPTGYETIYFDRETREISGSVNKYLGRRTPDKLPSTYMDQLDYQEPLPFEFLIYLAPETVWRADMRRFRERFRYAPQARDYFAFLKGTDGLLHIRGAERLQVALHSLDKLLREIESWCGSETEIVLFSDHGMALQPHRRVHLQEHLRRSGFELSRSLINARDRSAVLPAFGLIGFASLYCVPGDEPALADAIVPLEGIDFLLFREDGCVVVTGKRGKARIHRREDADCLHYRYELIDGDPLQLATIARNLQEEGQLTDDGYASAATWTSRTAGHMYPDALDNLYSSLQPTRVQNPADVLASLQDGYYCGWSAFEYVVSLVATHGNASRASSTAFIMSTHRPLPAYVTAGDAKSVLKAPG